MNIPLLWRSFYAEKSPISHLLRTEISDVWFRVHALPQSKRYAENESEKNEILRRYNCVASEVLGENSSCALFFPGYSSHENPNLFARFERQFFYRFRTEDLRLTMFAAATKWQSGRFDEILDAVANYQMNYVLWMNQNTGEIFAPYDGGADLFLSSTERRDTLKTKCKNWLSIYPEGL